MMSRQEQSGSPRTSFFGIRTYWTVRGIWTAHTGSMLHEAINWVLQSLQWLPAPTTKSQTQWNTVYLDGKLLLDGNAMLEYRGGNKRLEAAVTHHMGIEREDVDVEAQVITKTRNYWFLDGSNTLDGKKNLNSIYRKEYIQ